MCFVCREYMSGAGAARWTGSVDVEFSESPRESG